MKLNNVAQRLLYFIYPRDFYTLHRNGLTLTDPADTQWHHWQTMPHNDSRSLLLETDPQGTDHKRQHIQGPSYG